MSKSAFVFLSIFALLFVVTVNVRQNHNTQQNPELSLGTDLQSPAGAYDRHPSLGESNTTTVRYANQKQTIDHVKRSASDEAEQLILSRFINLERNDKELYGEIVEEIRKHIASEDELSHLVGSNQIHIDDPDDRALILNLESHISSMDEGPL